MITQFSRTELLIGEKSLNKLKNARVAVFGLGGVGGYVAEALARSGVGTLDIIDNDTVSLTNINRQIFALHSTIGMKKTQVAEKRLKDINPDIKINAYDVFYLPETSHIFNFKNYDYIVDAIDTVTGKIEIIANAKKENVPVISSMGTGNKLDPLSFEIADISKTSVCPLAKVMRKELKSRGIKNVKVLYSKEIPQTQKSISQEETKKRQTPASISFVPSVAGLIIAGEVIKDLLKEENE